MTDIRTQNGLAGFPRWGGTEDGDPGRVSAITGTNWDTGDWPVANINKLPLSLVARSTASTATIRIVYSRLIALGVLGLVGHTYGKTSTLALDVYSDAGATTRIGGFADTEIWPVAYPFGSIPIEDEHAYDGKYTDDELAGITWTSPFRLDQTLICQAIDLTLKDPDGPGTNDLGFVETAAPWYFSANPGPGFEYGPQTRSQKIEAAGGYARFLRRRSQPVWQGSITWLKHNEAMGQGYELQRRLDITDPFLIWFDPGDVQNQVRNCAFVRNAALSRIKQAGYDADEYPLNLEGVL